MSRPDPAVLSPGVPTPAVPAPAVPAPAVPTPGAPTAGEPVLGVSVPAAAGPHLPARPGWYCRYCDRPWPCPPVRVRLRSAYGQDLAGLAASMSEQLFAAAADFGTAELSPELIERFLTWTEPRS